MIASRFIHRRGRLCTRLVLAAALGFFLSLSGPPEAVAGPKPGTLSVPVVAQTPVASYWPVFLRSRTRMFQAAVVIMALGIFILTRGRWK
jgi:hypothetical protein